MSYCSHDEAALMAKTAVGSVQNWIIWVLTSGSCAICTGRHPLPVMEEPGCDAFAPSDAHQGKQPLLARIPTFLPIPIFPITVSQNPLLYKKNLLFNNFQFGQHNDRAQLFNRII